MLHDILVAQPQCNFVDSIDLSKGEFIDDRRSGVLDRKIASHEILLWQSPGKLNRFYRFVPSVE